MSYAAAVSRRFYDLANRIDYELGLLPCHVVAAVRVACVLCTEELRETFLSSPPGRPCPLLSGTEIERLV